jgi:imidazole glycerol phosphate synthase glutamine amidotransferase subunit
VTDKEKSKIRILDYGSGNIGAFVSLGAKIGFEISPSKNFEEILESSLLIVPGVGNAGDCVNLLRSKGMDELIRSRFTSAKPILAVCSGFQLFGQVSEETQINLLSLLPLKFILLNRHNGPIPSMGWRKITGDTKIVPEGPVFFSHSFHGIMEKNSGYDLSHYVRGDEKILASVRTPNFVGAQFHPEKSNVTGQKFIRRIIAEMIHA